jgi:putative ABC transport system substrate-binding protein
MKRREFITLLGGVAIVGPRAVIAQTTNGVRRVGVLLGIAETDPELPARVAAFRQGLEAFGWMQGQNVRLDYRYATGDAGRIRMLTKELVGLQPDLIVAHSTPVSTALLRQTRTIPIVFLSVSDPLGSGLVDSLSSPSGNMTGFTNFEFSMGSKWIDTLKEIDRRVERVAVIFNPQTAPYAGHYLRSVEAAASSFTVAVTSVPVHDIAELERAIATFASISNSALIVLPDIFTRNNRQQIISLAGKYRLPSIYPFKFFITAGGLISYGVDDVDLFRRAASYVDRILKGTKPAQLPVQQPIKYELAINLKTAKALGLDIPHTLLARADEVIE